MEKCIERVFLFTVELLYTLVMRTLILPSKHFEPFYI